MRRVLRALPIVAALVVLLAALYLVSDVEREGARLGLLVLWVFLITGVALLVLVSVIAGRLVRLGRDIRQRLPGARLSRRLVVIFFALALTPVAILYLFAVQFLSETIERWFDVQSEAALADAVELGQMFIELRTREVRNDLVRLSGSLETRDEDEQFRLLIRRVSRTGPTELTILDAAGRSQAFAHIDPGALFPDLPLDFALSQALRGGEYAAAEPGGDGQLQIRVLRRLQGEPARLLQAIYPLPDEFSQLAGGIEQAYFHYRNVAYLRDRLRGSLILILTLVLALTGLLAMLLALNAAHRLVAPVRELADATQAVTAGEFPREMPVKTKDELGFLVRSFNTMTRELAASQRQLEEQRRYLETVLGRLSSGVIAIDAEQRVGAYNDSAETILGLKLAGYVGAPLRELARAREALSPLVDETLARCRGPGREWRREIKLGTSDKPLVLMCRGSALPDDGGHVVVFDDVTMLDQAQREAAWAEVARRLAHEVKNPLTPIRLAAERMQGKLAHGLPEAGRVLVDKTTGTIIAQVDALKRLVDSFGDYAREPATSRQPVQPAELIREMVDLYSAADESLAFELDVDADLTVRADADGFRQVLHNLIRNAVDAAAGEPPTIRIRARRETHDGRYWLGLTVKDDGPGFPDAVMERLFEPYVSTKTGGTGLGLPIVRRIVESHGGEVRADNPAEGGARVRIRLPLD